MCGLSKTRLKLAKGRLAGVIATVIWLTMVNVVADSSEIRDHFLQRVKRSARSSSSEESSESPKGSDEVLDSTPSNLDVTNGGVKSLLESSTHYLTNNTGKFNPTRKRTTLKSGRFSIECVYPGDCASHEDDEEHFVTKNTTPIPTVKSGRFSIECLQSDDCSSHEDEFEHFSKNKSIPVKKNKNLTDLYIAETYYRRAYRNHSRPSRLIEGSPLVESTTNGIESLIESIIEEAVAVSGESGESVLNDTSVETLMTDRPHSKSNNGPHPKYNERDFERMHTERKRARLRKRLLSTTPKAKRKLVTVDSSDDAENKEKTNSPTTKISKPTKKGHLNKNIPRGAGVRKSFVGVRISNMAKRGSDSYVKMEKFSKDSIQDDDMFSNRKAVLSKASQNARWFDINKMDSLSEKAESMWSSNEGVVERSTYVRHRALPNRHDIHLKFMREVGDDDTTKTTTSEPKTQFRKIKYFKGTSKPPKLQARRKTAAQPRAEPDESTSEEINDSAKSTTENTRLRTTSSNPVSKSKDLQVTTKPSKGKVAGKRRKVTTTEPNESTSEETSGPVKTTEGSKYLNTSTRPTNRATEEGTTNYSGETSQPPKLKKGNVKLKFTTTVEPDDSTSEETSTSSKTKIAGRRIKSFKGRKSKKVAVTTDPDEPAETSTSSKTKIAGRGIKYFKGRKSKKVAVTTDPDESAETSTSSKTKIAGRGIKYFKGRKSKKVAVITETDESAETSTFTIEGIKLVKPSKIEGRKLKYVKASLSKHKKLKTTTEPNDTELSKLKLVGRKLDSIGDPSKSKPEIKGRRLKKAVATTTTAEPDVSASEETSDLPKPKMEGRKLKYFKEKSKNSKPTIIEGRKLKYYVREETSKPSKRKLEAMFFNLIAEESDESISEDIPEPSTPKVESNVSTTTLKSSRNKKKSKPTEASKRPKRKELKTKAPKPTTEESTLDDD